MKRNLSYKGLSLLMAAVALFSAVASAQAQDKKPNILFIMGDDIGMWKIGAYHRIVDLGDVLSCLGYAHGPYVCTIGFTVYSSFESPELAQTGVMPVPDISSELPVGGHEVLAVGYDIGPIPSLRPANCPPAVLIQNSWGTSWGLGGYFWMPTEVVADPNSVQDIWMVHLGQPWKK